MRNALFVLALGLTIGLAGPALAEDVATLKSKAAAAITQRDWKAALAHLQAAYALDPQPDLNANIGFVQFNLGQYPEAAIALEQFLASNPPPNKAVRAREMLDDIKPVIKLRSDPMGATVEGPEGTVGRTPVDLRLLVGTYTFRMTKPDFAPLKVVVEVKRGNADQILRTLIPLETGPRTMKVTSAEPDRSGTPTRVAPWVALAGTVVATAGAASFYFLTQDAIDQRDGARSGSAWDSHQVDAETWNTAMLTSAGVAAVTAGVTAWLFSR